MLRASAKRHQARRAAGASVRAALQPPSNGGNQSKDGGLVELGEVGDGHHDARCIRLDAAGQDVAISAAIELG